ncbi:MAG: sigma-70 family RNA polymerase sigma factor, partial [Lachnospiraceae bacterium]|nr:sigma-70 family RNA polymerase sigma factor [Lachnospiraceae bacterium]
NVRLAKNKDKNALERVLTDINPLIKKYASHVQCIEYEDACQELCLSLIRCIYKMRRIEDIGQCLVCFKICMSYEILAMNRRATAEKCFMRFENLYDLPITIDDWQLELSETLVDLETALETLPRRRKDYISYRIYGYSEKEIACRMGVSRQTLYHWRKLNSLQLMRYYHPG